MNLKKNVLFGFLTLEDEIDRLFHYSLRSNPEQRSSQRATDPSPDQHCSYLHYRTLIPHLTANKRIAWFCVTLFNTHFLTVSSCQSFRKLSPLGAQLAVRDCLLLTRSQPPKFRRRWFRDQRRWSR